jgi:uncharacterized membrane protein SpoIIM required for sporulation
MNLDRFVDDRLASWSELDELVREAHGHPERLGPGGARRLGRLYRSAAADLALGRRAFPGDPTVAALEQRVGAARHLVYRAPTRRDAVLAFFRSGYWQSVREKPLALALSAALLLGSAAIASGWAYHDPGSAATLAPGAYQGVTQPRPHGSNLELSPATRSGIASQIFTNNIEVTFLVLAGGVFLGLGSAVVLLFNGVQLGVVGGLAVGSGNGSIFFELVTAHGLLELSCIVVAGAAGLRLGWAIVDPGRKTRTESAVREARRATAIVLGTAPWLVVAGLVEGFLTPSGLTVADALAIGVPLATLYWTLVLVLGRPRPVTPGPATSP